jgi:hypothetical protein
MEIPYMAVFSYYCVLYSILLLIAHCSKVQL